VKTAQKSANPCPRNVGEFVRTLGPVRSACRSPAKTVERISTKLSRQTADGLEIMWFKLLKSIGCQVGAKMSLFGQTLPYKVQYGVEGMSTE